MKLFLRNYAILLLSSVIIHACGTNTYSEKDNNERPDFDEIPIFELAEVLRVFEFNDGEFFGNVSTVFSGAGETILVSDLGLNKVHLFNEVGSYRGFVGGDGEGPGEFRQLGFTRMLAPDTLMTLDWQQSRITLFGFDPESQTWGASRFLDRPTGVFEYGDQLFFSFRSLSSNDNGYIGLFQSSFTPVDTATYTHAYFTHFDYNLNPLTDKMYRMHIVSRPMLVREGDGVRVGAVPDNHRLVNHITDDGRFINTWSGSRTIKIQQILGADSLKFSFPAQHQDISASQKREKAIKHIPNPEQAMFTREQIIDRIPDYYGYSKAIITDDENRIWIQTRPFEEGDPEWLVYNSKGELQFTVHHPGGRFHQIKNNRIYANITSENGEPGFAIFEIR